MPANIQFQELIEKSIHDIFFGYLAIKASILGHAQANGHLNNGKLSKPQNFLKCRIVEKLT